MRNKVARLLALLALSFTSFVFVTPVNAVTSTEYNATYSSLCPSNPTSGSDDQIAVVLDYKNARSSEVLCITVPTYLLGDAGEQTAREVLALLQTSSRLSFSANGFGMVNTINNFGSSNDWKFWIGGSSTQTVSSTVAGLVINSNIATVTTSSNHQFKVGHYVDVYKGSTWYDSATIESVPSSTTFTFAKTAANETVSGVTTSSFSAGRWRYQPGFGQFPRNQDGSAHVQYPALTSNRWHESPVGDGSAVVFDGAVFGWRASYDALAPQSYSPNPVTITTPTPTPTNSSAKQIARVSEEVAGLRSIKLDLELKYRSKLVTVSFKPAKGKSVFIGSSKANIKGDISITTRKKLSKGGTVIFKIGKKKVGEVVVN
jgi:hypothetical protein